MENLCSVCEKPSSVCVCSLAQPQRIRHRVVVLQHPQEQDVLLGTAPLLKASLPTCEVHVGLSWPSLKHVLNDPHAKPSEWLVLYPASLPYKLTEAQSQQPCVLLTPKGVSLPLSKKHKGVIVLDGTWSQAKALWWRNAWLLKCHRVVLHPQKPSIYGRLRKEPKKPYVSTLESVAFTLSHLGEPASVEEHLLKTFRTMVQRIRDVS